MAKLPILIVGFIRVDGIQTLLNSLQVSQISKIYLAIDGPRISEDQRSQEILIEFARAFAREKNLPISIWQRKCNLGIAVSIISAIDWFFFFESFGAILEDDLVVGKDFLHFILKTKSILEFQNSVMMVSGNQFFSDYDSTRLMATRYPQIWGWATTREKWKVLRNGLLEQEQVTFRDFISPRRSFWAIGAKRALVGKLDTWDVPIAKYMRFNSKLCLLPPRNLVSNVGYDQFASHTSLNVFPINMPIEECDVNFLELDIPSFSKIQDYDKKLEKYVFKLSSKRILSLPIGLIRLARYSKSNSLRIALADPRAAFPEH